MTIRNIRSSLAAYQPLLTSGDGWSVETLDKCRKFYRVYSSKQISSTMQTKLNIAEVKTRYEVGRFIYEDEQQGERAAYGQQILRNLSKRLTERFGNDWSYDTLKRCRKFYQAYENAVIGATPLPQLEINNEMSDNKAVTNCGNNVAPIRMPRFTLSWSHYKEKSAG